MSTVGVEEEFLLVDAETRFTVPRAPAVLKRVGELPVGAKAHAELLTTQVEFASGVCTSLAELRAQLVAGREALAEAAAAEGALLVPSGTPVLAAPAPLSAGERFERIADMYRAHVEGYQCCGCHVHVGVPDRDVAIAVVNHLRPWLPTLLALSANSPFDGVRDTGYASWRMLEQAKFPGSGVPPRFADAAHYDAQVAKQVAGGVVVDSSMGFWLARPSPRYPTVEVRVADTAATVDDAVLQAGLTLALVEAASSSPSDLELDDQVLAAAVWSAARYGLDGFGVDPWSGVQVPAVELVRALLDHVADHLDPEVGVLVERVLASGTGAARQRRAGSPREVVDQLCVTPGHHTPRNG